MKRTIVNPIIKDTATFLQTADEAGGKISDFNGEKNYIFGKEIVASNSNIYSEFQGVVKNYMVK